jgi:hypothetical protein
LNKITTRLAQNTTEDSLAFCRIMNELYSRKVDEHYYKWQFFDTPHQCGLVFIEINSTVVGHLGIHVIPLQSGDKIGWFIDIAIAKDFQGKGLFNKLYFAAEDFAIESGASALAVMSNPNAHKVLTEKHNWHSVREIDTWVLEQNNVEVNTLSRLDTFTANRTWFSPPDSNFSDHSSEWLNRRFSRNPRYKYSLHDIEENSRIVTKEFTDPINGEKFIDIVEFLHCNNDANSIRQSFEKLISSHAGLTKFITWLETGTEFDSIAKLLGFRPIQKSRFFDVKLLDSEKKYLIQSERWHLTMQDAEVY